MSYLEQQKKTQAEEMVKENQMTEAEISDMNENIVKQSPSQSCVEPIHNRDVQKSSYQMSSSKTSTKNLLNTVDEGSFMVGNSNENVNEFGCLVRKRWTHSGRKDDSFCSCNKSPPWRPLMEL